jgi:hypothetical protein
MSPAAARRGVARFWVATGLRLTVRAAQLPWSLESSQVLVTGMTPGSATWNVGGLGSAGDVAPVRVLRVHGYDRAGRVHRPAQDLFHAEESEVVIPP